MITSKHALKIEDLDINEATADEITNTLSEFLLKMDFTKNRISNLDCRSRDGFIPYNHNKGGLEAIMFSDQENVRNSGGTGFENSDETLEKYYQYDIEYFETKDGFNCKSDTWTEDQWNEFYDSRYSDSEASVMYGCDVMHTGFEKGIHSINIRITVCVKDSPYHRQYDDLISIDLTFRTLSSLERQLARILKRADVKQFSKCLREAY